MDIVNLVVMGKTGAGKSTLINAILGEDRAPTDKGQAATKRNVVYEKVVQVVLPAAGAERRTVGKRLRLYDTVGLELNNKITQETLKQTQKFIQKAQQDEGSNDMSMVWFCVNSRGNRFESYELNLMRSLTLEFEIPFSIVLTQCLDNTEGPLEKEIQEYLPGANVKRVLAKDYHLRGGATINSFGVPELLQASITTYNKSKICILEGKLEQLKQSRNERIAKIKTAGEKCIKKYECKAEKWGRVPIACIPFIHGMCESLIKELSQIAGVKEPKDSSTIRIVHKIVGMAVTPAMAVPVISSATASTYVGTVGKQYWEALLAAIENSTDEELYNNELMSRRIEWEIKNRKKDS